MKRTFTTAAALLLSVIALFAQTNDKDYMFNTFWDNWTLNAGGGMNYFTHPGAPDSHLFGTPNFNVGITKWVSPFWGGRVDFQGLKISEFGKKGGFGDLSVNLIANASSLFFGYDRSRKWDVYTYLHAGAIYTKKATASFGGGVTLNRKLGQRFNIYADLRASYAPYGVHISHAYIKNSSFYLYPSIGLSYNIGKYYWDSYIENVEDDKGNYDGAYVQNRGRDNWFITVGAGIANIFETKGSADFNGSVTPAVALTIGKWFSPTLGFRVGYQGFSFSEWGLNPREGATAEKGVFRGREMYRETINYAYPHVDVLINLISLFNGYTPGNFWNLSPYIHAGYIFTYSPKDGSASMGGGVPWGFGAMNTFRINDNLRAFVDFRLMSLPQNDGICLIAPDKDAGKSFAGTALAGVSYTLGRPTWTQEPQLDKKFSYDEFKDRNWALSFTLLDFSMSINADLQKAVARNWTTDVQFRYNPWEFVKSAAYMSQDVKYQAQVGVRYWPWYTFSGLWLKGALQAQNYRRGGFEGIRPEMGNKYGVAASVGYSLMITKWFNIDFGAGLWGGFKRYQVFADQNFETVKEKGGNGFISGNELSVSASFIF
ncbi:MAG: DUF3575 domain-containing protein [Bacteroidales bacterium]|nr:DUF3575 domain-containing protein [Candidatus Cacconaster merdequi]